MSPEEKLALLALNRVDLAETRALIAEQKELLDVMWRSLVPWRWHRWIRAYQRVKQAHAETEKIQARVLRRLEQIGGFRVRRFRTISAVWAQAIRDDVKAGGSCTFHRDIEGITRIAIMPTPVRIRVAKVFPPPLLNRPTTVVYRHKPPACRQCGDPIKHGEKAIRFGYDGNQFNFYGRTSFIHEEPCQ